MANSPFPKRRAAISDSDQSAFFGWYLGAAFMAIAVFLLFKYMPVAEPLKKVAEESVGRRAARTARPTGYTPNKPNDTERQGILGYFKKPEVVTEARARGGITTPTAPGARPARGGFSYYAPQAQTTDSAKTKNVLNRSTGAALRPVGAGGNPTATDLAKLIARGGVVISVYAPPHSAIAEQARIAIGELVTSSRMPDLFYITLGTSFETTQAAKPPTEEFWPLTVLSGRRAKVQYIGLEALRTVPDSLKYIK